MFFFELPAPDSFWVSFLPAITGALIGGLFVIWALLLQQRGQENGAVRALILEMTHNAATLSGWTRLASEQSLVPPFPVLARSVFDEQLPLISKRLAFRDLVKVMRAYSAIFVLGPGLARLTGGPKLSCETLEKSKIAADRFYELARSLAIKFLTRKERKYAEAFFVSNSKQTARSPANPAPHFDQVEPEGRAAIGQADLNVHVGPHKPCHSFAPALLKSATGDGMIEGIEGVLQHGAEDGRASAGAGTAAGDLTGELDERNDRPVLGIPIDGRDIQPATQVREAIGCAAAGGRKMV